MVLMNRSLGEGLQGTSGVTGGFAGPRPPDLRHLRSTSCIQNALRFHVTSRRQPANRWCSQLHHEGKSELLHGCVLVRSAPHSLPCIWSISWLLPWKTGWQEAGAAACPWVVADQGHVILTAARCSQGGQASSMSMLCFRSPHRCSQSNDIAANNGGYARWGPGHQGFGRRGGFAKASAAN